MQIRVGPDAVNAQSSRTALNGLAVSTPAGERHWYGDEVRAWFTGRPLPPLYYASQRGDRPRASEGNARAAHYEGEVRGVA